MKQLKVIVTPSCDECIGACCAYYTAVSFSKEDASNIAAFLKIELQEFYKSFTENDPREYCLKVIKKDKDGICVFFNNGCTINDVKPWPCKNYKVGGEMCSNIFTKKDGSIAHLPSNKNHGVDRLIALLNRK